MPAEEIGRRARVPGCQVDSCFLWSIANFPLIGRQVFAALDPSRRHARAPAPHPRLLGPGRGRVPRRRRDPPGVGHGDGDAVRRRDDRRAARRRRRRRRPRRQGPHQAFSATLVNYLFLLYFDTRAGYCDTGPYAVPGHPDRTLLVRDFYRLGHSDFWWSDVAADVPYTNLTAAVRARRRHLPRHRLRHVEPHARGLPRPGRRLRAVTRPTAAHQARSGRCPSTSSTRSSPPCGKAQSAHYRNIAAMARDGEDPLRRLRLLHVPAAVRRGGRHRRRPRLDRAPRPPRARSSSCSTRWRATTAPPARGRPLLPGVPMSDEPERPAVDPADEGRHEPGREQLWSESWYFDFCRARRVDRRLDPPRPVPEPRAWPGTTPSCAGPDRPTVAVVDAEVPLPKPPSLEIRIARAVGRAHRHPPARALAGRQRGARASPSTTPPSCTARRGAVATSCRWASTSSGRPRASRTTTGT